MLRSPHFVFAALICSVAFGASAARRLVSTGPQPLKISSLDSDFFSTVGHFEGTYQVMPGYIEVNFARAHLNVFGSASNQRPRVVSDVKIALAHNTRGNAWGTGKKYEFAAADKVLKVGETLQLTPKPVRIPIDASTDLSGQWLVVEITILRDDPAHPGKPSPAFCYAHSSHDVFAAVMPAVERARR
jgi:hypothetical protein